MNRLARWLPFGVPIIISLALAGWAAYSFATSIHGYVAAYVNGIVLLFLVAFAVVGLVTVPFRRSRSVGIGALIAAAVVFPTYWVAVNVLDSTGNITWRNQPLRSIGPDVHADLVVYLKLGVTNEQIDTVWESVLSDPDPRGGHWPLPGIAALARVTPADGHEAIAVALERSATQEAVATIRNRLDRCEYVYNVVQDVVPSEVEHVE